MKILSCYKPKDSMPLKELKPHFDSYLHFGNQCVFYSNVYFEYDGVDCKNIEIDPSTHPFLFKHLCIEKFFANFPNEDFVLYVDTDTFCNDILNFVTPSTEIAMSSYSKEEKIYNSGVMFVTRNFVSDNYHSFKKTLCGKKVDDELSLTIYLKDRLIPVTELGPSMNYGVHRAKRNINCRTPKILHFHINKHTHIMRKYFSENLKSILI